MQFLEAHARDIIVAQAFLGIVQFEWEAFLVLLTSSQLVTTLPQGKLRRVTDAQILPIGIDDVGIDSHTGSVRSSPQGMLPGAPMVIRFKSGWLLFSWDFDCSRYQQFLC